MALVGGEDVEQDGDMHDWVGPKQPTWMPGTPMDLHLRWDYRITTTLEAPAAGEFVVAADVWRQDSDGFVPSKRFHTIPGRERYHETLDSGGKRSDARQRKAEGDGDAEETKRNTTVASGHPDGERSSTDPQARG